MIPLRLFLLCLHFSIRCCRRDMIGLTRLEHTCAQSFRKLCWILLFRYYNCAQIWHSLNSFCDLAEYPLEVRICCMGPLAVLCMHFLSDTQINSMHNFIHPIFTTALDHWTPT